MTDYKNTDIWNSDIYSHTHALLSNKLYIQALTRGKGGLKLKLNAISKFSFPQEISYSHAQNNQLH